ncbi:hypothetical protein INR49_025659 [Caranx melampygus]|nr:hypothetical protein INR49_025659 [Caranx melampygus]
MARSFHTNTDVTEETHPPFAVAPGYVRKLIKHTKLDLGEAGHRSSQEFTACPQWERGEGPFGCFCWAFSMACEERRRTHMTLGRNAVHSSFHTHHPLDVGYSAGQALPSPQPVHSSLLCTSACAALHQAQVSQGSCSVQSDLHGGVSEQAPEISKSSCSGYLGGTDWLMHKGLNSIAGHPGAKLAAGPAEEHQPATTCILLLAQSPWI